MSRLKLVRLLAALMLPVLRAILKKFAPELLARIETSIHGTLIRYTSMRTAVITAIFLLIPLVLNNLIEGSAGIAKEIWREMGADSLIGELAGVVYGGLLLGMLAAMVCVWGISKWRYLIALIPAAGCTLILAAVALTLSGDTTGVYGYHPRFWLNTLWPVVYVAFYVVTVRFVSVKPSASDTAQAAPCLCPPTTPSSATASPPPEPPQSM